MEEEELSIKVNEYYKINLKGTVCITGQADFGPSHYIKMCELIKHNKTLTNFSIYNYTLTEKEIECLAEIVETHPEMTSFQTIDIGLNGNLFKKYFHNVLINHPGLIYAFFSGADIGDECAISFIEDLKHAKLTAITFQRANLTDKFAEVLGSILKVNNHIKYFDFDQNQITDKGFSHVLDAMKINTTVTRINFSKTEITKSSLLRLLEIIKYDNSTLSDAIYDIGLSEEEEKCFTAIFDVARTAKKCRITIKDYECIRIMGKGCFGTTYLAIFNGRPLALKELRLPNAESIAETEHEVKLMKLLNHDNLVRMMDSFTIEDKYYILMELVTVGDMTKKLALGRWESQCGYDIEKESSKDAFIEFLKGSGNFILRWMRELCDGVNNMHKTHIVHLDLKPANIFLTHRFLGKTSVKIGDFGISNCVGKDTYVKTEQGTPDYVAPEIWFGYQFKYEPDIFALGVIFHELLLMTKPFPFIDNVQELADRICSEQFDPKFIKDSLYGDMSDLICKMLTKDRKKRIKIDKVFKIVNKMYFLSVQSLYESKIDWKGPWNDYDITYLSQRLGTGTPQILEEWENEYGRLAYQENNEREIKNVTYKRIDEEKYEDELNCYMNSYCLRTHPRMLQPNIIQRFPRKCVNNIPYFIYENTKDQVSNMIKNKYVIKKSNIVLWLINVSNALQYAFDNGFKHGNLNNSQLFLDSDERIKLCGFQTTLKEHLVPTPYRMRDGMADSLKAIQDIDQKKQYKEQFEAFGSEMLDMVQETRMTLKFPIPNIKRDDIIKDIRDLGIICMEMYLLRKVERGDARGLIKEMPGNWQPHLNQIICLNGISSIVTLRQTLHDLFQEEVDPEFLIARLASEKIIGGVEIESESESEAVTQILPKIGGEEVTQMLPKIGGGRKAEEELEAEERKVMENVEEEEKEEKTSEQDVIYKKKGQGHGQGHDARQMLGHKKKAQVIEGEEEDFEYMDTQVGEGDRRAPSPGEYALTSQLITYYI